MTAQMMTIYDPDGAEFEMYWTNDIRSADPDEHQAWCDFCQEPVTEAWFNDEAKALFVLCPDCAKANATAEGR